jgi:glycerol-3-phosphate dehydrogenase
LRDFDKLVGIVGYREYQFEWPERICLDMVLDAERIGAVVRNYTMVEKLVHIGEQGWSVALSDCLAKDMRIMVRGKMVLNMAGIWIDRVNAGVNPCVRRRVTGTKGAHIMVQLPAECRDYGIATLNRHREPFYCLPWRGMHYLGPTETLYEGDIDDISTSDDEIDGLIAEANHLFPSLSIQRSDVLFTWAGVRPLTYDPAVPKGKRSREVHDLTTEGMPDVLAMTAGPIMTHRSAGAELTKRVRRRLSPSRPLQWLCYAARRFPEVSSSPPLLLYDASIRISDLRYSAEREHAANLVDLLLRRTGIGWNKTMGLEVAQRAAEAVAEIMGWDEDAIASEVRKYQDYLTHFHTLNRFQDRPHERDPSIHTWMSGK